MQGMADLIIGILWLIGEVLTVGALEQTPKAPSG